MRKLLSFVIVTLMIVSLVVPAFALKEAPDADQVENTIDIWVEDAELDPTEATTVDVYVSISGNTDGFEYMKFFIVYPKCLTLNGMYATGLTGNADLTKGAESAVVTTLFANALDECGYDPYEVLGLDKDDPTVEGSYKWAAPFFDCQRFDDGGESIDLTGDGRIIRFNFTYNESLNTFGNSLPLRLFDSPSDQLHCYRDDYKWSDEEFEATVYDGTLKIISNCTHVPGDPVEENVVPATCTESGSYDEVVYCSLCGEKLSEEHKTIDPLEHSFTAEVVAEKYLKSAADCTNAAVYYKSCVRCEIASDTETFENGEALGHNYGDWYEFKAATPDEDGIERQDCSRCDAYNERPLPYVAHTHTIEVTSFTPPTSVCSGLIVYECTTCSDYYEEVALPACGDFAYTVEDITVNAGETGDVEIGIKNAYYGVEDLKFLVYWDEALADEYVPEITFSDEVFNVAGDEFDYAYLSEDEAAELLTAANIDFDVAGKDFAVIYVTVGDGDFTTRKDDGAIAIVTVKAPATGDEYNVGVVSIDVPNVMVLGKDGKLVGFIDYELYVETEGTVTVHHHIGGEPVEENVVPATCTKKGSYDAVVYCTGCGAELSRTPTEIDYADHVKGEAAKLIKAPTADAAGVIRYACATCGQYLETFDEALPAYGQFDIAFEDITINEGEKADAAIVLTNGAYGVDSLRFLVYWDAALADEYVPSIAAGEIFAEEEYTYAYLSVDEAAALIEEADIDFDVDGKEFAVLYFEIPDDDFAPRLDSGVLATMTFKAPANGAATYNYGIINIDNPNVVLLGEDGNFAGFIDYAMAAVSAAEASIHYHTAGEAVEDPASRVESTCVAAGHYDLVTYCTECGKELSRETVELPLAAHVKGETAIVVKAPTATMAGTLRYACAVCGQFLEEFDEEIPATGTLAINLSEGGTICAEENLDVAISFVNGVYGVDSLRFLVYWDEGLEPVFALSDEVFNDAGDELEYAVISADKAAQLIDAAGLKFDVEGKAFAVIYFAAGDDDFTVREGSGKLADITFYACAAGGDFEVGVLNIDNPNVTVYGSDGSFAGFVDYDVAIGAPAAIHAHYYEAEVTEPTCTEGGYTTYTCAHCGDSFVADEKDALGHNYVEEVTIQVSCSQEGLLTYTCSRCQDSYTQKVDKLPHTPKDEWEVVTEPTPNSEGLKVLKCSVCGEILDQEVIAHKTIDLVGVKTSRLASIEVDNDARVINITTKRDELMAAFQLKLAGAKADAFSYTDDTFAAGNSIQIQGVRYSRQTDAIGVRYFLSFAENGFNQTLKVDVTVGDEVYDYTVNVTFDHTPAFGGVIPGYTAKADRTGVDPDDPNHIIVVSKDGQKDVTFRLDVAAGIKIRVTSADKPRVIQTFDKGATYQEIDASDDSAYNDGAFVYFKTVKADGVNAFDITLTYQNGETEVYHVDVIFS